MAGIPAAGFVQGLAQGFNQAFNRHMDRKYEQELRDRANLQKMVDGIDIPQAISEKHKNVMSEKLNSFRGDIVKLTQNKPKGVKGFLGSTYSTEDILTIQGKANMLGKEFFTLTQDDRRVAEEMKIYQNNRDAFDYDELQSRLKIFSETGVLPGGSILSKKAMGIQDLINTAYEDRRKALGTTGIPRGQVVKGNQKITTFDWGTDVDRLNFYAGAIQDEAVVKGLARHMAMTATPEQMDKYTQGLSAQEKAELYGHIGAARVYGNTREIENNPAFQNIAKQWGLDNVAPVLLQPTTKVDFIDPYDIGPHDNTDKEDKLGYKHYDNATMLDGSEGPVDIFKQPVTTSVSEGNVYDVKGHKVDYNGEEINFIQRGNGKVFGEMDKLVEIDEATYTKQGGSANKNLKASDDGRYFKTEKIKVWTDESNVKGDIESQHPTLKLSGKTKKQPSQTKNTVPGALANPLGQFKVEDYRKKYNY